MRAVPGVIIAGTMGWTPVVGSGGTWSIEDRRPEDRQHRGFAQRGSLAGHPGVLQNPGHRDRAGPRVHRAGPRGCAGGDGDRRGDGKGALSRGRTRSATPSGCLAGSAPWVTIVGVARDILSKGAEGLHFYTALGGISRATPTMVTHGAEPAKHLRVWPTGGLRARATCPWPR